MKIVLLESLGVPEEVLNACAKPLTDAGHTFVAYPRDTDPQVQIARAGDADVIMIANMPLRGEVIAACPNLKYIDVAFTGVDHVDLEAARGPVVDSQALADALNSGYLAGAGIDVFEAEPPLDTAHPLLHSKNTIVTPHVAFASAESMEARCRIVFDNIRQWLAGEPANVVL